jgi:Ca2+-binding RTX toxin-like protein
MQCAPEALNTLLPRWWDWLQNQATERRLAAALNPLDAPGDGGALLAEWLLGGGVNARERSQLAMEIDGGTAIVHGEPVHVERTEITGTEGDDVLTGTVDADWIQGLAGNGLIYSDPGSDTIDGGTGTDYYNINYSDSTSAMVMVFDPTTGNGSITIGSEVDTLASIEAFINPYYWAGWQFIGTPFNDVLLGSDSSEVNTVGGGGIRGGDGNDSMSGNGGHDILYGEAGDDILDGGAGDDDLDGSEGNDNLIGSAPPNGGIDTLLGGNGNDLFVLADAISTGRIDRGDPQSHLPRPGRFLL